MKANRTAVVLAVTLATLVGFAPATFALGRPLWLILFTVLAGLTSTLTLRKFATNATEEPTMLEFILSGLGAVFPIALTGLLWLVLDWSISKFLQMLRVPRPDSIAFWCTLPVAAALTLAYSNGRDTAKYLYSETAGTRSAYYPLIAQRRPSLIKGAITLVAILVALSAVFIATGHVNTWLFFFFLEIYLLVVGVAVLPTEEKTSQLGADRGTVEKIAKVFEAAGYEVEGLPRTGKAEIDPLLSNLDLLARKGGDRFAIEVKTKGESAEPVDWKIVSGLRTAVWALSDARGLPRDSIRAMLILLDVRADRSLRAVTRQEPVLVVSLTGDTLDQLGRDADTGRIQETVARWTAATGRPRNVTLRNRTGQPRKRAPHA